MQLVVADPALDDVVVGREEVVGEGGVVEPGRVDGLHGEVAVDPRLPLAAVPAVDDVEVRALGERPAGEPLAAAERRVQPGGQPEHRPRRRGDRCGRRRRAAPSAGTSGRGRSAPPSSPAARPTRRRRRGRPRSSWSRRYGGTRASPTGGQCDRSRSHVPGPGGFERQRVAGVMVVPRPARFVVDDQVDEIGDEVGGLDGSWPMRSTSSRNIDDEQMAAMRSTTSARRSPPIVGGRPLSIRVRVPGNRVHCASAAPPACCAARGRPASSRRTRPTAGAGTRASTTGRRPGPPSPPSTRRSSHPAASRCSSSLLGK